MRDEIIAKLKAVGGDPTRRFQEMGYDMRRVAGRERRVGWTSLTLDVKRGWTTKFAMDGYPLEENPTISKLLAEYASIEDDDFKAIEPRHLRVSVPRERDDDRTWSLCVNHYRSWHAGYWTHGFWWRHNHRQLSGPGNRHLNFCRRRFICNQRHLWCAKHICVL